MEGSERLPNVFERKEKKKEVRCKICNCWLPSGAEKFIKPHLEGRKHKQHVQKIDLKNSKLKRSIYVKGFHSQLENLEDELKLYIEEYGVTIKDLYVDKNQASYAIVELSSEDDVLELMCKDRSHFHGRKLVIRKREPASTVNTNEKSLEKIPNFMNNEMKNVLQCQSNLHDAMALLYQHLKLTDEEKQLHNLMCSLIQTVLEEVYSTIETKMFGSSVNGLGVSGCDVDLTILINENIIEENGGSKAVFSNIREILEKVAPGCKNVSMVTSTKHCDIIKFYHTEAKVHVDLSLNNRLALRNTLLIQTYMNLSDQILLILFTLRIWAKSCDIIGRKSHQISSYSLTLMFIHFLQQKKGLPNLQDCCHNEHLKPVTISGWDCAFCDSCSFNDNLSSSILVEFFCYFRDFCYDQYVVSIHKNNLIHRCHHKDIATKKSYVDQLNFEVPLFIVDPFNHSHNVTQNVNSAGLQIILSSFKRGISTLKHESTIESFIAFLSDDPIKLRCKQKKQRNRSNVYLINLPNCCHANKKEKFICEDIVFNILTKDLKFNLSYNKESTTDSKEEINISAEDSDKSNVIANSILTIEAKNNGIGSKRKFADDACNSSNKKLKLKSVSYLSFIATAYEDTWTNRRKQRRLIMQKSDEMKDKVNGNGTVLENSTLEEINSLKTQAITSGGNSCLNHDEDKDYSKLTSPALESEKALLNGNNSRTSEVLKVSMKLTRAKDSDDVCKLTMAPENALVDINKFQTFFAFFKKELVSRFK